jgi:hypothetical protein
MHIKQLMASIIIFLYFIIPHFQEDVMVNGQWNQLLSEYVSAEGQVDYAGLKSETARLKEYLNDLAMNTPEDNWTREKKMAYWINAYNAFTVKLILDNYPLGSIMDLKAGKVWDWEWIELGDKTYTLNDIEHKILRARFKDPRIHFAVNCASKSCPPLMNKAWTESNLEEELDKRTRNFINDPLYNKITEKKVEISKIFEWYSEDFPSLIDFLNQYSQRQVSLSAKIAYLPYDWSLNSWKKK